jgi:hypothetical protein
MAIIYLTQINNKNILSKWTRRRDEDGDGEREHKFISFHFILFVQSKTQSIFIWIEYTFHKIKRKRNIKYEEHIPMYDENSIKV